MRVGRAQGASPVATTPPGRPSRRSRRGELPPPLARKYFTRGALLELLEARGWRQFPASGLHTWVYYTPEGLARRANKEPTVHNVDFVLDDDELYAYVELHGILDELVREKEAKEKTDEPKKTKKTEKEDAPMWLHPSTPPPFHPANTAAQSAESEDAGFIPASDDDDSQEEEEEAPAGSKDRSKAAGASRKRPRLRTGRAAGEKPARRQSSSSSRVSTASKRSTPRSSPAFEAQGEDDDVVRINREYAASKRELHGLEQQLEELEQRVKKKRFAVHKLRIERDCHRERQRKLRELKEQFFGAGIKQEPGIRDCD